MNFGIYCVQSPVGRAINAVQEHINHHRSRIDDFVTSKLIKVNCIILMNGLCDSRISKGEEKVDEHILRVIPKICMIILSITRAPWRMARDAPN